MIRIAKKMVAALIGAAMAFSGMAATTASAVADGTNATQSAAAFPDPKQATVKDVTVVAFQQSWKTIAQECTNVYGPEGVGYVQISPPEESVQGTQWWTVYQPVSYKLDSRFGTEAELENMIKTCNTAGVQIIADVVLNHTTGHDVSWIDDQYGVAGTAYNGTYGRYPGIGIYQYEESGNNHQYGLASGDFHSCRKNISDYMNATEVQECRLSTMWDINTGNERVQDIQAEYLAKLWKLGVRGFRIDSSKHIASADLAGIKAKLAEKISKSVDDIPFQQEVIYHQGEASALAPKNYTGNGDVTEFSYAYQLRQYFNGDIGNLQNISNGLLPSDKATVFVSNWDTARGSETLTYDSGSKYELANAFMLANDYGKPKIMSDYYFTSDKSDDGPTGTTDKTVTFVDFDNACSTTASYTSRQQGDWLCQQRWVSIRGMIGFRNAVAGTSAANWQKSGTNNIGFSRRDSETGKDKGFMAINNTLQDHEVTYKTTLPDGVYCNVYATHDCSQTVTVSGGSFTATIGKRGAIAIYDGATADTWQDIGNGRYAASGYDDQVDTSRLGDTDLTIYYKPDTSDASISWADGAYIQYASGETLFNEVTKMETVDSSACADADGWYRITIKDGAGQRVRFRFTNSANGGSSSSGAIWDYQSGNSISDDTSANKLYETAVGTTIFSVDNHDETIGMPYTCPVEVKTTFTVHFKASGAAQGRAVGVVVWGTDTSGTELKPEYHGFNATEDSGQRRMSVELSGDFTELHYRVVGEASASADAIPGTKSDYTATVIDKSASGTIEKVRGAIESWLDGSDGTAYDSSEEKRNPATTPQPNDVKNPKQLTVIVHYMRADGNYQEYDLDSDTWKGWDLWTWSGEQSGSPVKFTEHDDYGMIARYTLTQEQKGNRTPEFILRQGGDAWSGKDPDGRDRIIPESAIQVEAGNDGTGTAEIWLISGDSTIYTRRPAVSGVTFESQGGWWVGPQAVLYGEKAAKPDDPQRLGYVFTGWTTDQAGAKPYDFDTPVTGRLKLWAQWESGWVVNFNLNGGKDDSGSLGSVTVAKGGSVAKPSAAPVRDGYGFAGWSVKSNGGENDLYDFAAPVEGNLTLYAVWKAKKYTVTFNADGGEFTGVGASSSGSVSGFVSAAASETVEVKVDHGEKVTAPDTEPTKTGKRFAGWVTKQGGNIAYDFDAAVAGDLTLYAMWVEPDDVVHKVTFHRNDGETASSTAGDETTGDETAGDETGSGETSGDETVGGNETLAGDEAGASSDESADSSSGSGVAGSDTTGNDSGTSGSASGTSGSDVSDSDTSDGRSSDGAGFSSGSTGNASGTDSDAATTGSTASSVNGVSFIERFVAKAGKLPVRMTSSDSTEDTSLDVVAADDFASGATLTDGTSSGKSSTASDVTVSDAATNNAAANNAAANNVTASDAAANVDTGIDVIHTIYVVEGKAIDEPDPLPVRAGYRLDGWAATRTGIDRYELADGTTVDLDLYAIWIKGWTVRFVTGDSSVTVPDQVVNNNGHAIEPEIKRQNYVLEGWYTDSDRSDKSKFDFTTAITEDITLYAKWTEATWTIKFDLNGGTDNGNTTAFADQQIPDGGYAKRPTVTPTREGYTFEGWTTVKNDALGRSVFPFEDNPIDRNGTLYALWVKEKSTK